MSEITTITSQTSKEYLPDDADTLKEMVLTLLGKIDIQFIVQCSVKNE